MENKNITWEIFKSWLNKALDRIDIISNVAFLIGIYIVVRYNTVLEWWKNFLILGLYFIAIMEIQSFDRWYKRKKEIGTFPVRKKRFTKQLDDAIVVKKSDWEEAMLYLSEIEDYLGK